MGEELKFYDDDYAVELMTTALNIEPDKNWSSRAACKDMPKDLFYGVIPIPPEQITEDKKVCASCEVVLECLREAIDFRDKNGIWGGLTEKERDRAWKDIIRKRRR